MKNNRFWKKTGVFLMAVLVVVGTIPYSGNVLATESVTTNATIEVVANGIGDLPEGQTLPVRVDKPDASPGEMVTITAEPQEGYYLAQIRVSYQKNDKPVYQVFSIDADKKVSENTETFTMPETSAGTDVTVYGDYISIAWDGTVDLTWYNTDDTEFEIAYGAQLAGAAVLVNGIFNDIPTREYTLTEEDIGNSQNSSGRKVGDVVLIPDITNEEGSQIDPNKTADDFSLHGDVASADDSCYQVFADTDGDALDTTVVGDIRLLEIYNGLSGSVGSNNVVTTNNFWFGGEQFTGKTLTITDDLNMGGTYSGLKTKIANWSGPNYMGIGGGYSMDPGNPYTRIGAAFNGTLDGAGHMIYNIYGSRHVTTGFGNCQGYGLVGILGSYRVEFAEQATPAVKNVAVDGVFVGNRMIGGIVGQTYHSKGLTVENCMNFASICNSDAKGCAGIIGNCTFSTEYRDKQPKIYNCVNFGYISSGWNKNTGGLIGLSEGMIFDSYSVGFVDGIGRGNMSAANTFGTNNGGAVWYNCYGLAGGSTTVKNIPGQETSLVYNGTVGSAMRELTTIDACYASYKDGASLLSMLNGKVKTGGTDKNGYMTSDESMILNTRKNWVTGEETEEKTFVSGRLAETLQSVSSYHDPSITITQPNLCESWAEVIAAQGVTAEDLNVISAIGMPVPSAFVKNRAKVTKIMSTGTPTLTYLSEEVFDTGDHENQSVNPQSSEDAEYSLWAIYDDGTYEEIETYQVIYQHADDRFKAEDTEVTISVDYKGCHFDESFYVTVEQAEVLKMEVTGEPQCVLYAIDELFEPKGMVLTVQYGRGGTVSKEIKATYQDGQKISVSEIRYTINDNGDTVAVKSDLSDEAAEAYLFNFSPREKLTKDDTEITVTHTFGGAEYSDTLPITILSSASPRLVKDGENDIETVYITSEDDFLWFANQVSTGLNPAMNAELENDITLTSGQFASVGAKGNSGESYKGVFHGNGHTISFYMNRKGRAGLFYQLAEGSEVDDLIIAGTIVGHSNSDNEGTGAVTGVISGGTIKNCTNRANVSDNRQNVGGLVGKSISEDTLISGCVNEGTVTAPDVSGNARTGGIVGFLDTGGTVSGCLNRGTVDGTGENGIQEHMIGGIVGSIKKGTISSCRNDGIIRATGLSAVGGIAGSVVEKDGGFILSCYNTGAISVEAAIASKGSASNGSGDRGGIGGILGRSIQNTSVKNCYHAGTIDVDHAEDGGDISAEELTGALIGNVNNLSKVVNNIALEGTAGEKAGIESKAYASIKDTNIIWYSDAQLKEDAAASKLNGDEDNYKASCLYPQLSWETAEMHDPGDPEIVQDPGCTETGLYRSECKKCGETFTGVIPATGHSLIKKTAIDATCEEAGSTSYYTCETCRKLFSDAKGTDEMLETDVLIPPTGHTWGAPAWTWTKDYESASVEFVCENDAAHSWEAEAEVTVKRIEPTAEENGSITYTAEVTGPDDEEYTDEKAIVIPATGYTYGDPEYEWMETETGWQVTGTLPCNENEEKNISETVNVSLIVAKPAGCDVEGLGTYTAEFTNTLFTVQTKEVTIPAAGHAYGEPDWTWIGLNATSPAPAGASTFKDVKISDWFYTPVSWAATSNPVITKGINKDLFGVGEGCTREMFVTFLWRAAGEPEPEAVSAKNQFSDVKDPDRYFYKPIYWAYQNGITTGLNDGTGRFGVGGTVTRGMVVTFLYRYAMMQGEKGQYAASAQFVCANDKDKSHVQTMEAELKSSIDAEKSWVLSATVTFDGTEYSNAERKPAVMTFGDVPEGRYYHDAVYWAAANGITVGHGGAGKFSPEVNCTREQVVTFLYRIQ